VRRAAFLIALALCVLSGCGYVGPVVPPSPEVPSAVIDLSAAEIGDQIQITFTTPPRTTDNLAIRKFSAIELSIGPASDPFVVDTWAEHAQGHPVPLPPANEPDLARATPISFTVPASDWQGQHIAIGVRTAVKKQGHASAWSNIVHLEVVAPLTPPELKIEGTAQGYRLSWTNEGPGVRYQVMRQAPTDTGLVTVATVEQPEFIDVTTQWSTPYTYQVTAVQGTAVSRPSNPVVENLPDKFAPAAPTGLTALAANSSVELSWQRSPELDLKGYFVYRSSDNAPPQRIGALLQVPNFRDTTVQAGKVYKYAVSAVDRTGNESGQSASVEATP
jgi:fibronectin type 3 domain-containing protein